MRKFIFLLSGLSLMMISCNNVETPSEGENKELSDNAMRVESLFKEVIEVHDRVMAQKGNIGGLINTIKRSEGATSVDSLKLMQAYTDLKRVDNDMMVWMREFDAENATGGVWSDEQKIIYLESEKNKMQTIEKDTDETLAHAKNSISEVSLKPAKTKK